MQNVFFFLKIKNLYTIKNKIKIKLIFFFVKIKINIYKMVLIGLVGKKGSGKDTLKDYITKNNNNIISYAFADPLKEICGILFQLSQEQLYGHQSIKEKKIDELNVSPRILFQRIGTNLFRNELLNVLPEMKDVLKNDSIWIFAFKRWYKKNKHKNVIVSDVRFENEAKSIREMGGILIYIDRYSNNCDQHESEKNIEKIKCDFVIKNKSTIIDLYKNFDKLNLL